MYGRRPFVGRQEFSGSRREGGGISSESLQKFYAGRNWFSTDKSCTSATRETVVKVPSATRETVVEVPSATRETVVEVPSATRETEVEVPSATRETVVEVPSATRETVVEVLSATRKTVVEVPPVERELQELAQDPVEHQEKSGCQEGASQYQSGGVEPGWLVNFSTPTIQHSFRVHRSNNGGEGHAVKEIHVGTQATKDVTEAGPYDNCIEDGYNERHDQDFIDQTEGLRVTLVITTPEPVPQSVPKPVVQPVPQSVPQSVVIKTPKFMETTMPECWMGRLLPLKNVYKYNHLEYIEKKHKVVIQVLNRLEGETERKLVVRCVDHGIGCPEEAIEDLVHYKLWREGLGFKKGTVVQVKSASKPKQWVITRVSYMTPTHVFVNMLLCEVPRLKENVLPLFQAELEGMPEPWNLPVGEDDPDTARKLSIAKKISELDKVINKAVENKDFLKAHKSSQAIQKLEKEIRDIDAKEVEVMAGFGSNKRSREESGGRCDEGEAIADRTVESGLGYISEAGRVESEGQIAGMRTHGHSQPQSQGEGFGEWEKHTKGIRSKLLRDKCYQPGMGLGKNLQGRSNIVDAHPWKGIGAYGHLGARPKEKQLDIHAEKCFVDQTFSGLSGVEALAESTSTVTLRAIPKYSRNSEEFVKKREALEKEKQAKIEALEKEKKAKKIEREKEKERLKKKAGKEAELKLKEEEKLRKGEEKRLQEVTQDGALGNFTFFRLKENMRLAPTVRNDPEKAKKRIDIHDMPSGPDGLYLPLLKTKYVPGSQTRTWPYEKNVPKEDDKVEILEDESDPENVVSEEVISKEQTEDLLANEDGSIAQACSRFRDISYSDSLWIESSRKALAANQLDSASMSRCQETLSARDKVKLGLAWQQGETVESLIAVQNSKYMPRIQLDGRRLGVSWGSRIWCHPRLPQGGVAKTTSRVLRGHSDDVSKFVVSEGMVVSGGRDRSLCGWSQHSGEFLFARRYCHGGEITAVDVTARGAVIVTGSRDKNILVWNIQEDPDRDALLPVPVQRTCVDDRVWCVAANDLGLLAVGTAGTRGVPPVRLYDLASGTNVLDMGTELKNGAGMLDMTWLNTTTFLACGYDTFTRLWDTRCRTFVRSWEEPFDESVYCLATDKINCLVTGTSRHGRVRVWDMRCSGFLYMKYSAPARRGQSSPVYSMAMDSSNLYVALDQSLNHFGFSGIDPKLQRRNRRF